MTDIFQINKDTPAKFTTSSVLFETHQSKVGTALRTFVPQTYVQTYIYTVHIYMYLFQTGLLDRRDCCITLHRHYVFSVPNISNPPIHTNLQNGHAIGTLKVTLLNYQFVNHSTEYPLPFVLL